MELEPRRQLPVGETALSSLKVDKDGEEGRVEVEERAQLVHLCRRERRGGEGGPDGALHLLRNTHGRTRGHTREQRHGIRRRP